MESPYPVTLDPSRLRVDTPIEYKGGNQLPPGVVIPEPVSGNQIEVSWKNLTYTVDTKSILDTCKKEKPDKTKVILKGLSGYFRSGQLTAVMGPSGDF